MDTKNQLFPWLDLIDHPVFCVKGGIIIAANYPAEQRLLHVGMDVRELVAEHQAAYESFESGSLYLTIPVCGVPCPVSVTRTRDYDIFHLHQDEDNGALQALALAASRLRSPLSDVMIAADLLIPELENADPAMQRQARQINQGLYRLLRLVCNMSDASSSVHADMQTVDISAVINEIMDKAQSFFTDTNLTLDYTGINTPVFGLANAEKLERAVYNLLSNAAKFSPAGSTITACLTKKDNQLLFTVTNATNIEDADNRMWRQYQRELAIEDPRHGIGLGMTLISGAAALHGGTVLVDHPTMGTTRVSMTIPIVKDNSGTIRSSILRIGDYAGGRDKGLLELSELLSSDAYKNVN